MKQDRTKIIVRVLFWGAIYPVVTFILGPIAWVLWSLLAEFFSSEFVSQICWYIYYAPCLISFGVTALLIPEELTYFRIVTFFIVQLITYYIVGALFADFLFCYQKHKRAPK